MFLGISIQEIGKISCLLEVVRPIVKQKTESRQKIVLTSVLRNFLFLLAREEEDTT